MPEGQGGSFIDLGCIRVQRATTDIMEFPDPHPDDADPPEWYPL